MKKSKKNIYFFTALITLIIVGVVRYGINISGMLEHASSYIAYPFIRLQYACMHPIKRWVEKRNAVAELEMLVHKYQKQSHALLAELIACKSEACLYAEIREIIDFNKRYSGDQAISAQILVRNFSDESHFFLIDRGAHAGLEVDMVVVYKNCLVGRVIAVYPWYSKVLLVTDKLCKVPALSIDHKARGIYMGSNSLTMSSFAYVSHLETLNQGELLISSGEGLIFPKGFGLGIIKSFDVNNADYTYTTSIEPLIDLRSIDYCSVIKKGTECN